MGFKFVKEEVARVAGRDTMEVHVQRWKDARKETLQLRLSDCNEIRQAISHTACSEMQADAQS